MVDRIGEAKNGFFYALPNPFSSKKTLLKTALVALVVIGVLAYCISSANAEELPLNPKVTPDSEGPILEFPKYLPRFSHPQTMSNELGDKYCLISGHDLPSFSQCNDLSERMFTYHRRLKPESLDELLQSHRLGCDQNGIFKELPQPDPDIRFRGVFTGANPSVVTNLESANKFLEKTVLNDPQFFKRGIKHLMNTTKTLHKVIARGFVSTEQELRPGSFRDHDLIVWDHDTSMADMESVEAALIRVGETKETFEKVKKYLEDSLEKDYFPNPSFSIRAAINSIGYFSPPPKEIPTKMRVFINKFQKVGADLLAKKMDPVEAAAWVHTRIVEINPFQNANGRVARAWMNTLLQLGGYRSVIIPKADEYVNAIRTERDSPGYFGNYLKRIIAWNRKQTVLTLASD